MQQVVKEAFMTWFFAESAIALPGLTNGQASPDLKCKQQVLLQIIDFSGIRAIFPLIVASGYSQLITLGISGPQLYTEVAIGRASKPYLRRIPYVETLVCCQAPKKSSVKTNFFHLFHLFPFSSSCQYQTFYHEMFLKRRDGWS